MKKLFIILLISLFLLGCEAEEETITPEIVEIDYSMRFGVNGGAYPDIREGEQAVYAVTKELDKLGYIWLRHPGQGTEWSYVEEENDQWNWEKIDAILVGNNHPWVLELYGAMGNPYPFGNDLTKQHLETLGGKQEIIDYIISLGVDMNDPQQRADAEDYVKTYVSRYKDRVKYWEIGNEGISAPERYDVVVNTYSWIKEAYPESIVILTAVAGDDHTTFNTGLEAMDTLLEQGMGDYFDAANFHYYGRITDNFEGQIEKTFDDYKAVLDKYDVKKPIWVTETATSSHEHSVLSGPSSEALQAQHVVKRLVIYSAKGAEKVFWHDYRDTYEDNKFYKCNLVDYESGVPKPSYYTFKLVVDKIGFYESVETLKRDGVWLYKFNNIDNVVYVAWGSGEIDLSEYIDRDKVQVTYIVEEPGQVEPIAELMDTTITLSESPVFIE